MTLRLEKCTFDLGLCIDNMRAPHRARPIDDDRDDDIKMIIDVPVSYDNDDEKSTACDSRVRVPLAIPFPLRYSNGLQLLYNDSIIYYRRVAADGHRDGTTTDSDLAGQSKDYIIFLQFSRRGYLIIIILLLFLTRRGRCGENPNANAAAAADIVTRIHYRNILVVGYILLLYVLLKRHKNLLKK